MTGVQVTVTGHVGTITISNQGKRNALSPAILSELTDVLEEVREDVRCLVLTGAGAKAFSSGFDLSAVSMDSFHEEHESAYEETMQALAGFPYPTIAKVNGDAIGGGFDLSLSCDLRISSTDAGFCVPTASIGIVYSERAIRQMVRLLGPADAKRLLFTGERIDAETADDIGVVDDAVDADELDDSVAELAESIAGNAPLSLTASKQIVDAILDADHVSPTERERIERLRMDAFESDDFEEGLTAIAEGRDPDFTGN